MKSKKGFTLIEVLAVLVILSILITFSVVSVSKIKKRQEIENRINVIRSILTAARAYEADNPNTTNSSGVLVSTLLSKGYVDFDTKKYSDLLMTNQNENRKITWSNKYYFQNNTVKESDKLSFVFEEAIQVDTIDTPRFISDCGQETEQKDDKIGKVLCEAWPLSGGSDGYFTKCKTTGDTTICAGWDSKGKYYDTNGNSENDKNLNFN